MRWKDFENLLHRLLLHRGWRVQRAHPAPSGWESAKAYWDPPYLKRMRFQPATVIDVGVAHGTAPLYDAFPEADLVLVEPLIEFAQDIERILAQRRGTYIPVALSDRTGEREIQVEPGLRERSSLFARTPMELSGDPTAPRRIPVRTLDDLVSEHNFREPFGLKLDVEGAELEIIRGAGSTLPKCEFVIAEVGVPDRFYGGYSFAEFIAEMSAAEFRVCDILDIGRAPSSEVIYFDLVFQRCGERNVKL